MAGELVGPMASIELGTRQSIESRVKLRVRSTGLQKVLLHANKQLVPSLQRQRQPPQALYSIAATGLGTTSVEDMSPDSLRAQA